MKKAAEYESNSINNDVALYVVATPIGNLSDISQRALDVLSSVDFIAAEDTRKSGILLDHFGIKKPMVSYFEHNLAMRGEEIISKLKSGKICALISDAGMPAISDPGEVLVRQCHENGLRVSVIPGPCAAVTALAMSGLPTGRFCFEGFLTTARNGRIERLTELKDETRTMIFYEAPHKLRRMLADMFSVFGERRLSLVREMTKIYEDAMTTTLTAAIAYYEENEPRGEYVLIVAGAEVVDEPASEDDIREDFISNLKTMPRSEAAKETAKRFGRSKREIYAMTTEGTIYEND